MYYKAFSEEGKLPTKIYFQSVCYLNSTRAKNTSFSTYMKQQFRGAENSLDLKSAKEKMGALTLLIMMSWCWASSIYPSCLTLESKAKGIEWNKTNILEESWRTTKCKWAFFFSVVGLERVKVHLTWQLVFYIVCESGEEQVHDGLLLLAPPGSSILGRAVIPNSPLCSYRNATLYSLNFLPLFWHSSYQKPDIIKNMLSFLEGCNAILLPY